MPTFFSIQKKLSLAKIESESIDNFLQASQKLLQDMDPKHAGINKFSELLIPIQQHIAEYEKMIDKIREEAAELNSLKNPQTIPEKIRAALPGTGAKIAKLESGINRFDRHLAVTREMLASLNNQMRGEINKIVDSVMSISTKELKAEINRVSDHLLRIADYLDKMKSKSFIESYPGDYPADLKRVQEAKIKLQTYKKELMEELRANASPEGREKLIKEKMGKQYQKYVDAEKKVVNQTRFLEEQATSPQEAYDKLSDMVTNYRDQLKEANLELRNRVSRFRYAQAIMMGLPQALLERADFIDRPRGAVKADPGAAEKTRRVVDEKTGRDTLSAEDIAALREKYRSQFAKPAVADSQPQSAPQEDISRPRNS